MRIVDTEQARGRLEAMLAELDRSIDTLTPGPRDPESHGTPGDADAGLDLADNDRASALLEVATAQRAHVRAALQRVDADTYGRCVDCGEPLPDERLEARPEAARCVRCQAGREARHEVER